MVRQTCKVEFHCQMNSLMNVFDCNKQLLRIIESLFAIKGLILTVLQPIFLVFLCLHVQDFDVLSTSKPMRNGFHMFCM